MYELEKLHPIQIDNLIRLGREGDGGYVILKQQIEKTDILLSFGANTDKNIFIRLFCFKKV
jgi:hypothetical protein